MKREVGGPCLRWEQRWTSGGKGGIRLAEGAPRSASDGNRPLTRCNVALTALHTRAITFSTFGLQEDTSVAMDVVMLLRAVGR